jgi:branched-chain amino acid transport system substrate-binding protein
MKKWMIVMAVSTAALVLGSCARKSGGEIRIGMLYNMTGAQASLDGPSANGAKLAAKEINAAGGVLGRKIELVGYDGKTDAATIGTSATQLASSDKVVAMFGFSDTDMVMAAAPIAAKAGIMFVTSGATSPKLPSLVPGYLYLACFGDNVQAAAAAEYAWKTLNAKSAYLLVDKGMEYTMLLGKYFRERFAELGGAVTMEDFYQTGDKDFSAQITKLKASRAKADILFISSGPDDAGSIVKQFREGGLPQPIFGGDGYDTPLLVQIAGAGADDVYFTTHSLMDADAGSEAAKKFIAAYRTEYRTAPENAFAGLGYDTVKLIADAIARAKSAEPAAIREALQATENLAGVTGSISFGAGSAIPRKGVALVRVKSGKLSLAAEVIPESVPAP